MAIIINDNIIKNIQVSNVPINSVLVNNIKVYSKGETHYLTITSTDDIIIHVQWVEGSILPAPNLQYSTNTINWSNLSVNSATNTNSRTIYLRGLNPHGLSTGQFSLDEPTKDITSIIFLNSGNVKISGDILSLVDYETLNPESLFAYAFYSLFDGLRDLAHNIASLDLRDLILSNVPVLLTGIFCKTFCSAKVVNIPRRLPNPTVAGDKCFCFMFYNNEISSISNIDLYYSYMGESAFQSMFGYNLNLTAVDYYLLTSPNLKKNCYRGMFSSTKIQKAPKLYATGLAEGCYDSMFLLCPQLDEIHISANSVGLPFSNSWVIGVKNEGKFYLPSGSSYNTRGINDIPENWEILYE